MSWVWISVPDRFTCSIDLEVNRITKTAPILNKFKGQDVENLRRWLNYKFNNYIWKDMTT